MEKYLGIYNNNSVCAIDKINFDNDTDLKNLENEQYEQTETIEELEAIETESNFLHIYEATTDDFDITTYKYVTTKSLK